MGRWGWGEAAVAGGSTEPPATCYGCALETTSASRARVTCEQLRAGHLNAATHTAQQHVDPCQLRAESSAAVQVARGLLAGDPKRAALMSGHATRATGLRTTTKLPRIRPATWVRTSGIRPTTASARPNEDHAYGHHLADPAVALLRHRRVRVGVDANTTRRRSLERPAAGTSPWFKPSSRRVPIPRGLEGCRAYRTKRRSTAVTPTSPSCCVTPST